MIYIEDYIIQNYIINLCLLRLLHLTNKNNTHTWKMIVFGMIYTILSAYISIFNLRAILIFLLRLTTTIISLKLIFKTNLKETLSNLIFFTLYQFAFYGAITNFASTNFVTESGIISCYKFNINKILVAILLFEYFTEKIAKIIILKIKSNNYVCKIKLINKSKTLILNAFIDSGNMLNLNGKSVIILSVDSYIKLTNSNVIELYLHSKNLQTKTVVGEQKLPIVEIDKIEIFYGKRKVELMSPLIALSNHNFKNANYQALVSPVLL